MESQFADQDQQQSDPLEKTISTQLWRWAFGSAEQRAATTSNVSELASALEWYLCRLLCLVEFTDIRRIWCDGFQTLSIERLHRRAFLIIGVLYCPTDQTDRAPFELEFHYERRRDNYPQKTILRFGELDEAGEIRRYSHNRHAAKIIANRPRLNRDWAVAVEIGPATEPPGQ